MMAACVRAACARARHAVRGVHSRAAKAPGLRETSARGGCHALTHARRAWLCAGPTPRAQVAAFAASGATGGAGDGEDAAREGRGGGRMSPSSRSSKTHTSTSVPETARRPRRLPGLPLFYYKETSKKNVKQPFDYNHKSNVDSTQRLTCIDGERFRKRERLCQPSDFQFVMRKGGRVNCEGLLTIFAARNDRRLGATCSRIGIVVSKKVHKHAVKRNLIKRWLRDIFRKNKDRFPPRADIVLLTHPPIMDADYHKVKDALMKVFDTRDVTKPSSHAKKKNLTAHAKPQSGRQRTHGKGGPREKIQGAGVGPSSVEPPSARKGKVRP